MLWLVSHGVDLCIKRFWWSDLGLWLLVCNRAVKGFCWDALDCLTWSWFLYQKVLVERFRVAAFGMHYRCQKVLSLSMFTIIRTLREQYCIPKATGRKRSIRTFWARYYIPKVTRHKRSHRTFWERSAYQKPQKRNPSTRTLWQQYISQKPQNVTTPTEPLKYHISQNKTV